jgi:uncharacterized membrane protein
LLNLVPSCIAALQTPSIMMSQNRAALRDRLQADQDFRVNLKAEIEIAILRRRHRRPGLRRMTPTKATT